MKRGILNNDAALIEKYSEEDILVLHGGFAAPEAVTFASIDFYCPVDNLKNCGCNNGCTSPGGGSGFSGGGQGFGR